MNKGLLCGLLIMVITLGACRGGAQEASLVHSGASAYHIIIPSAPSALEKRAATLLQTYVKRISGAEVPIAGEGSAGGPAIYIGYTKYASRYMHEEVANEGYLLQSVGKDLIIYGGKGKGTIYGVYALLERYLGCRKISNIPTIVPSSKEITIPGGLHDNHRPQFEYREVYYPSSWEAEYLEWNQLQQFEDLWGLWGHSYNKLVPAQAYFKPHPEYYALVKGVRQPTQLCLSNEDVYNIAVAELKKRMAANPDAEYWSVSPNDDIGYCTCDKCSAVDAAQGSPAGSLIKFVNRIAAAFPDKRITTLAYGYTHRAPKSLKPAGNVYVFLSDIDAYRDRPLAEEPSAAPFRNDLKAWKGLTPNLFVWDYVTQFTNYLAPFPNLHTLQANMQFFKDNGIKGVFEQGSGETNSEFAALRSYLLAKLLQDDKADVKKLAAAFYSSYYGNAGKYVQQYADMLQEKMLATKRKLDIYGNPVNEWNSYLTPELLDGYSAIFDKADAAAEGNADVQQRVVQARLPLDYTVLQQARFYGIEKHGIFIKDKAGDWSVREGLQGKINRFVAYCQAAGVTELSEGGLSPDKYAAEWEAIIKQGVMPTKALGAVTTFQYAYTGDYPAKGSRTLTDGNPGYTDFSYNWLCFYGVDMVATIDLGKPMSVTQVKMHFLDDPRHWIFLPPAVTVAVSADGADYHTLAALSSPANEEHYDVAVKEYAAKASSTQQVRYIKVTAVCLPSLPLWRARDNKKPMIACDEVYVQ